MGNALDRSLMKLCARVEADGLAGTRYRQQLHIMPPVGWLNDPNGLHQKNWVWHVYFQYAPFDVNGGLVFWGHATSRDLVHWDYAEPVMAPAEEFDCHGVYSGSALVEDGHVTMFYTGNVKQADSDGSNDYIYRGREANTVMVEARDGQHFGPKRLIMTNADYPSDLSNHVRDPYVWRDSASGRYLMIQGARCHVQGVAPVMNRFSSIHGSGSGTDAGEVLVFESTDLVHWSLTNRVTTPERFGFMWECPGYLELLSADGSVAMKALSVSPQGLEGPEWERRNIYQAGYFPLTGDIAGEYALGAFKLWDAGFDFYAPQVFVAEDGRRILIGWMGMPGDEKTYGNDPTVGEGWQHCLTFPRELTAGTDGTVLQMPAREIEAARCEEHVAKDALSLDGVSAFDLEVACATADGGFQAVFGGGLQLAWLPACTDEDGTPLPARLEMRFNDSSRSAMGCGRTVRWEALDELKSIRVLADVSSLEVFANGGELVMTTRYYPKAYSLAVDAPGADIRAWELRA